MGPLILYASETGNAEDVAYSLHRHWNCVFGGQSSALRSFRISSVEDYDISNLAEEKVVIFVLSTCGDGEFPIPMRKMWQSLLKRNLSSEIFSNMKFSVFGLGDSSYEKFNAAARKLFVRLQQLGAISLLEYTQCLGDDQAGEGYLAALDPWTKEMTMILKSLTFQSVDSSETLMSLENIRSSLTRYGVVVNESLDSINSVYVHPLQQASEALNGWKVYRTQVTQNDCLTSPDWTQAVHHLTFTNCGKETASHSSSGSSIDYRAGDIAQIYYCNSATVTDLIISYFAGKNPEYENAYLAIEFPALESSSSFRRSRLHSSIQSTLLHLFRDVLDISSIPKRSYFAALAAFASNNEEQDKLLEISSARGADLYYDYCLRERRNYVEVLLDFPSVDVPLAYFVGLVPIVQPRPYSIASSPRYKPHSLELCVAVVQRVTPYRRRRIGICSGYLAQLSIDDTVFLRIQRGSFPHFSPSIANTGSFPKHMILIGPGTGIAPMRAILQDRLLSLAMEAPTVDRADPSTIQIYFGCRRVGCDELYKEEWRSVNNRINPYISNSTIPSTIMASAHVAYSQNIGQLAKVYVTHLLEKDGPNLVKILRHPETFIGIAGSAKRMPKDVKNALVKVLTRYGDESAGLRTLSEEEAQEWLQKIIREKRLIVEAWG
jgi:sulfite reductase alpha subunit-like flavoprotein